MPSRDEELALLFRGIFLPEEGEVWAKPDASQQEFRFVVHYANQHKLRNAAEAVARYREDPDADFHAFAATITGLDRSAAKAVNFAKMYGAGVTKFAQMIARPLAEAQQLYARYDRDLPFLHLLSKIYTRRANAQGYIVLYDGARRHFDKFAPGGSGKWKKGAGPCSHEEALERIKDPKHPWYRRGPLYRADTKNAMNALIQGGAARHTKLWMRACWCEGIIPLLQMHDCLDCSVNSREQAELVARLGCEAVQLDVPMRVDLKYGRTWGDAKYTWEELHGAAAPAKPTKVNGHTFEAAPIPAAPIALPEHIAPEPEPESLDERLQKIPLADLIGEPLVHGKICCPFHDDDTPSLHIYRDHYYCFGCGVHGGHLDWLREAEGLTTEDAIKVIFDWQPTSAPRQTRQESDTRTLEWALALWHAAEPIADTPPIRYLSEVRGIDTDALPADVPLRFHPNCPFERGRRLPCLLALYQDVESNEPAGIHRIALTPDVFAGGQVQRRSLGRWPRPRAIKLWPAGPQLFVGEGIETVLAAATRLQYRGGPMRPAWAAGSRAGFAKLPGISGVDRLIMNGQGQAAAARCAERWSRAGRGVVKLLPKRPGADFNDIVKEKAA